MSARPSASPAGGAVPSTTSAWNASSSCSKASADRRRERVAARPVAGDRRRGVRSARSGGTATGTPARSLRLGDDPDLFAVRRIVRQVVPSDREPGVAVKPSVDRDRPRPRPSARHRRRRSRRVAREGPHHGEVVDDAPEHDIRVQRPELATRPDRAPRRTAAPSAWNAARSRAGDVSRRREQPGMRELTLAAGVEDPDLDRADRCRGRRPRPPPARRQGRTASCSRPGAWPGRRRRAAIASASARVHASGFSVKTASPASSPAGSRPPWDPEVRIISASRSGAASIVQCLNRSRGGTRYCSPMASTSVRDTSAMAAIWNWSGSRSRRGRWTAWATAPRPRMPSRMGSGM